MLQSSCPLNASVERNSCGYLHFEFFTEAHRANNLQRITALNSSLRHRHSFSLFLLITYSTAIMSQLNALQSSLVIIRKRKSNNCLPVNHLQIVMGRQAHGRRRKISRHCKTTNIYKVDHFSAR